jgi:hypothetical protein
MALAWEQRRYAEAGEPNLPGPEIYQHIGRLDVLVNEPASVEPAESCGEGHCDSKKSSGLHRPAQMSIQWLTACVLNNQQRSTALMK